MSSYENWDSVMIEFEKTEEFKSVPVPEHYNYHFLQWIIKNHYPPIEKKDKITLDGLVLDTNLMEITLPNGRKLTTQKKVFLLLVFLARNKNRAFNRDEILSFVWDENVYVLNTTVAVHINKIRKILGENSIVTVRGLGYKFNREGCSF